jgi:integrase
MCTESLPWLSQIVLMALVTGARKSEILTLHWWDINVQVGTLCFRQTKNGFDRAITLVDPVLTLLRTR